MPNYILEGRAIPDFVEIDNAEVPCIFCGTPLRHCNVGGDGWCCGAVVNGEARLYFYCNTRCKPEVMDEVELWRCACVCDYTENVGDTCAECMKPRGQHTPYVD